MASSSSSSVKKIHPSQSNDLKDDRNSKPRLLSSGSSMDHASPSSSQPQSSETPPMLLPSPLLQFKPLPLVDDGRSIRGFLGYDDNSYTSPSFIENHKLDQREFFEQYLMMLQQNDPTLLSLDIECRSIGEHEITRITDTLAFNSTLLELSIIFQQKELNVCSQPIR